MALTPGPKRCPHCQQQKPLTDFYSGQSWCKTCTLDSRKQRYQSDPGRNAYLLRTYGFTNDAYNDLLEAQDGRCAICRKPPPANRRLAVDHDHRTGQVRGLLCTFCNHNLLGRKDHDPGIFQRAHDYLVDPPARSVLGDHKVPTRPQRRRRQSPGVRKNVTRRR